MRHACHAVTSSRHVELRVWYLYVFLIVICWSGVVKSFFVTLLLKLSHDCHIVRYSNLVETSEKVQILHTFVHSTIFVSKFFWGICCLDGKKKMSLYWLLVRVPDVLEIRTVMDCTFFPRHLLPTSWWCVWYSTVGVSRWCGIQMTNVWQLCHAVEIVPHVYAIGSWKSNAILRVSLVVGLTLFPVYIGQHLTVTPLEHGGVYLTSG